MSPYLDKCHKIPVEKYKNWPLSVTSDLHLFLEMPRHKQMSPKRNIKQLKKGTRGITVTVSRSWAFSSKKTVLRLDKNCKGRRKKNWAHIFKQEPGSSGKLQSLYQRSNFRHTDQNQKFLSLRNSSEINFFLSGFFFFFCDARNATIFSQGREDTEDDTSGPSISETGDNNHSNCASLPACPSVANARISWSPPLEHSGGQSSQRRTSQVRVQTFQLFFSDGRIPNLCCALKLFTYWKWRLLYFINHSNVPPFFNGQHSKQEAETQP